MNLDDAPRVRLAHLPTPLERADSLSEELGIDLWIKRDDCTGLAGGGNKVRKLEFLLGKALHERKSAVVTFGGVQSNHARQTAAACARLGLRCELILVRVVPRTTDAYERNGNRMLDDLFGATVHVVDDEQEAAARFAEVYEEHGDALFGIGTGGSDATGALGYVVAIDELIDQMPSPPDRIFVAAGSSGTAAGLLAGAHRAGLHTSIEAIAVYHDAEHTRADIARIARELGAGTDALRVSDEWLGDGYGVPTHAMVHAIERFARAEGIALDPVYTGKAAAAMLAMIEDGRVERRERLMFLHTGGMPGLFAYPELFTR